MGSWRIKSLDTLSGAIPATGIALFYKYLLPFAAFFVVIRVISNAKAMEKESFLNGLGQLVGAILTSAALVFGTAYVCRELIVDAGVHQTQSQPEGIITVINK